MTWLIYVMGMPAVFTFPRDDYEARVNLSATMFLATAVQVIVGSDLFVSILPLSVMSDPN